MNNQFHGRFAHAVWLPVLLLGGCSEGAAFDIVNASLALAFAIIEAAS